MSLRCKRERLPKWAQDELASCERLIAELRSSLEKQQQSTPSNVEWGYKWKDEAHGYLSDHETITFTVRAGEWKRPIRVRLERDGAILDVNCDGQLCIEPRASNSVKLWVQP